MQIKKKIKRISQSGVYSVLTEFVETGLILKGAEFNRKKFFNADWTVDTNNEKLRNGQNWTETQFSKK